MTRNIYVGENYSRRVTTPLITTDLNAYKIIWDSECTNGLFKITAIKADETAMFDYGELTKDGLAIYVMANEMYNTEGPLKLFLTIVNEDSITTCREINFMVKKGADEAFFAENNINPLNSLASQVAVNNSENRTDIYNIENYGVTGVYTLQKGEDIEVTDNVVTAMLKNDYTEYDAIAFPEGIKEISLPKDTKLWANIIYTPRSLEKINASSFSSSDTAYVNNVKAEKIVFNKGLKEIGDGCFLRAQVNKITLPDTLVSVGTTFFAGSKNLKEIDFPECVQSIGLNCALDSEVEKIVIRNNSAEIRSTLGTESTVVWGYRGSTAGAATENNQVFKTIGATKTVKEINGAVANIRPNIFYKFKGVGGRDLSKIQVVLIPHPEEELNEYMFMFETPADISKFSMAILTKKAIEVKWVNKPVLRPCYVYEVSVLNDAGIIIGRPKEVE